MFRNYPNHIFGVDFSGALRAGKKIWISRAKITKERLLIEECFQGKDLPGSGEKREDCFKAIVSYIVAQDSSIFGLDFPFGIPAKINDRNTWEEFILSFPDEYVSPDEFWRACHAKAGGKELKRQTDQEKKAPFSPYNLWLYRQTYYGIREVLLPLVRNGLACVVPMQKPEESKPVIVEVCPASLLKEEDLYLPYKGSTKNKERQRNYILDEFEKRSYLTDLPEPIRLSVLKDTEGDALDSILACIVTFRALMNPDFLSLGAVHPYKVEGYVA